MDEIPWLTEALTALASNDIAAAEASIEGALQEATPTERDEVLLGWIEMLIADQRPRHAIALLEVLVKREGTPATQGRLWLRLARTLAAVGSSEGVASAVGQALRLGGVRDSDRVQVAADAIAALENTDTSRAHAVLLGALGGVPTPTTVPDLLEVIWTLVGAVGERARAAEQRELEAWSAITMSMVSGLMGELDGAILLARHAADAAVQAGHALAFSEAIRSQGRWVLHRDGHDAAGVVLRDAQHRWDQHFGALPSRPVDEWLRVWAALK